MIQRHIYGIFTKMLSKSLLFFKLKLVYLDMNSTTVVLPFVFFKLSNDKTSFFAQNYRKIRQFKSEFLSKK